MAFYRLKDMDLAGKRVLIRTGFDVPVDENGEITDDRRIKISLPTIEYALKSAKQVVIFFHMGRPKGREPNLRADKVALKLGELLGHPVKKLDDHGENGLPEDKIVCLENVRFDLREKDKDPSKRDEFGKALASLGDLFVQDAFSNSHHDQASMTSVPKFVKSCAGLSLEKEIDTMHDALKSPKRPFVSIIGGLKAEKLNVISNLLPKVDKILVGGALAFTVLKGLGYEVGDSKIDSEGLESFTELIEKIRDDDKVVLPVDAMVADRFAQDAESKVVPIENIEKGWMALDIGPDSIKLYKTILAHAKTVTWNGPIGVFEFEKFASGTKEIAEAVSETEISIIGGGDSADAIDDLGYSDKVTHVSTGGGASLRLLEGKRLVAVEALELNYDKYNDL